MGKPFFLVLLFLATDSFSQIQDFNSQALGLNNLQTHSYAVTSSSISKDLSAKAPSSYSDTRWPTEGKVLNYRLVPFIFPKENGITKYCIEIAEGTYYADDSFQKHVVSTINVSENHAFGKINNWGEYYSWAYICYSGKKEVKRSQIFHFLTLRSPLTDTNLVRLSVSHQAEGKYSNSYVFIDGARSLFDMADSKAIWILPDNPAFPEGMEIRDLKLTQQHTITFITWIPGSKTRSDCQAFEVDYDGNILYRSPNNGKVSGDNSEHLHHQFDRLSNGNYMALGNEFKKLEWRYVKAGNKYIDSGLYIVSEKHDNNKFTYKPYGKLAHFGTLIESDSAGNIIWSYHSFDLFTEKDLKSRLFYFTDPIRGNEDSVEVEHANSFYCDESNGEIYMGFRNLNCVVKINKEKQLLDIYGEDFTKKGLSNFVPEFCGQHSISIYDNRIYIFNNNFNNYLPDSIRAPNVQIIDLASKKKIFQYDLQLTKDYSKNKKPSVGGNVIPLGSDFLINSCGPLSQILIVDSNRKILFDAHLLHLIKKENRWVEHFSYRSSIILNANDFEKLIMNKHV